jgi:hypothetical protein
MVHSKKDKFDSEFIAIQGLHFLISTPDSLEKFLSITGIEPETLRTAAHEPYFLIAVLDFLCQNPPLAEAFALTQTWNPKIIYEAHTQLVNQGQM